MWEKKSYSDLVRISQICSDGEAGKSLREMTDEQSVLQSDRGRVRCDRKGGRQRGRIEKTEGGKQSAATHLQICAKEELFAAPGATFSEWMRSEPFPRRRGFTSVQVCTNQ